MTERQGKLLAAENKSFGAIECLGLTFPSEDARRAHFLEKLREKLADPEFRRMEGFPAGSDEEILALSDPPYFTACPNPFIEDFVRKFGKPYDPASDYHREPFAADVSEGKNHPIYNAHSYHTKVPHKAIMRYILHYTDPGDVVFDGFCGTGMTGVASALLSRSSEVQLLEGRDGKPGQRYVVMSDLSPIATFIASNLLRPLDGNRFLEAVDKICHTVEQEHGILYSTTHSGWKVRERKTVKHQAYKRPGAPDGNIEFTIYSDVVRCPECGHEVTLYEIAVDETNDALRKELSCTGCGAVVPESRWERVYTTEYDPILGKTTRSIRIAPVLINYSVGSTRYEKIPDDRDQALLKEAQTKLGAFGLPRVLLPEGKETRRNVPLGITHLHHFFTPREHLFVGVLLRLIQDEADRDLQLWLLFAITASLPYTSRMRRFRADRKGGGPLSGTLYVSSLMTPPHVLKTFKRNATTIANSLTPAVDPKRAHIVSTQDAGDLRQIPDCAIDYIFTDPPFGHNFDYSELNFFWEGILGVTTNQTPEAIVSTSQSKGVDEYRELMERCFEEYYRILKPGRWLTVEFSNTKAAVWNAIQSALERSGFVVANVASLDKKQHSFKAVTTPTAVKQDLVISAYKPNGGLEGRFEIESGREEGVWDFVRTHLGQLPVFVSKNGQGEVVAERQSFMLFDRMVAFHVRRGVAVPISATEFYLELAKRFAERDGMYFLPEQVAEYDKKRMSVGEILQLELFVTDEASAIQWLKQQLVRKPQTFQELHPQFLKELGGWQKHEKPLELSELLEQNFLRHDGRSDVPSQIHSYLSTNFRELRNLAKDAVSLQAKAKDRWYVPDPNKAGDLEKLRERTLLREFEDYRESRQKRLKVFRLEAVRAGFKKAWQDRDYMTIISVAQRIPEAVLQEDPKLLMWYDQALTRTGDEG